MKYVKGDVTKAKEKFIAHGCNCQGVMGSGVAMVVKQRWPGAFEKYTSDLAWNYSLGDCSFYETEDGKYILNLLTQNKYGTGTRHVNYVAIINSLKHAIDIAELDYDISIDKVAIPMIGAGLGGGDWNIIESLLQDFEKMYGIEFVVYTL